MVATLHRSFSHTRQVVPICTHRSM